MRIGTLHTTAGRLARAATTLVGTALLSGCVGGDGPAATTTTTAAPTPMATAEAMILGDLAEEIGLGPLTASCTDPGPLAVGSTFGCSATTGTGAVIGLDGTIGADGHIELRTTNLITTAALPLFEETAVTTLNDEVGSEFPADAVDCGSGPVVLPADLVLVCALRLPTTGETYDLTLAITDLDARHFALAVADEPRAG